MCSAIIKPNQYLAQNPISTSPWWTRDNGYIYYL